MNVVLLGGTKGMGRALARRLAERGDTVMLLGRDLADLERSARDLEVRAGTGTKMPVARLDLADPGQFAAALDDVWATLRQVDVVIVTAGAFGTQDVLEQDLERARQVLELDFVNTVLFCEHAKRLLLAQGGGTLCVFSSVAGDRGRVPVALYGSAKAGLSHYLESLDHTHHKNGLRVVCVKPGFVRTSMTEGLPVPPFAGEPEGVARSVVRAIDRGTPVVYAPGIWRYIMLVIRWLPRFIMRRIKF